MNIINFLIQSGFLDKKEFFNFIIYNQALKH